MIKKLLTVKEYCKLKSITDGAARKQINTGKVDSVTLDDQAHIVVESNEVELLKASLRSAREKIKTLEAKALLYQRQDETIIRLHDRIDTLETKLDAQRDSKEELMKQVIGQYDRLLPR